MSKAHYLTLSFLTESLTTASAEGSRTGIVLKNIKGDQLVLY
ncbi:hypothetical protein M947_02850 [Sulfurimonas hongkongensis]|uniref:Uncharacterized protein n=1 Tax=Sulfurimonas hongkongensis TaxID=1172190 RepID=T0JSL7_9BACT|nr:hypothetical protein M947_02850 [Sulfurimonas hongkongensis]